MLTNFFLISFIILVIFPVTPFSDKALLLSVSEFIKSPIDSALIIFTKLVFVTKRDSNKDIAIFRQKIKK